MIWAAMSLITGFAILVPATFMLAFIVIGLTAKPKRKRSKNFRKRY